MRRAILPRRLDAEDEERGGEGVGSRRGRRQHRDAGHRLGGPAGARVEQVAELAPLVFQVLEGGRRRRQGAVTKPDHAQAALAIPWVADADAPAAAVAHTPVAPGAPITRARFISDSVHAAVAA